MTGVSDLWRNAWNVLWVRGLGRLLAALLVLPIRLYQLTLSPLLGATCKYHPSCSRYAVGALQTHGPIKGLGLASWRLLRCNPWSKGGLDPVPDRGRWRPGIHPDGTPRAISEPAGTPSTGAGATMSPAAPPVTSPVTPAATPTSSSIQGA